MPPQLIMSLEGLKESIWSDSTSANIESLNMAFLRIQFVFFLSSFDSCEIINSIYFTKTWYPDSIVMIPIQK